MTHLQLRSFNHEDTMTDEGSRQCHELQEQLRAADVLDAIKAELLRPGRVIRFKGAAGS
jgi:hypothetical protein